MQNVSKVQPGAGWRRLTVGERIVSALLVLNLVVTFVLGFAYGDTQFGKVEKGRYFLSNHGQYVEVSRLHYEVSRFQTAGILPSIVLLILVGARAERRRTTSKS